MLQIDILAPADFDAAYEVFNDNTSTNWTYSLFIKSATKGFSLVAKQNGQVVGYCICDKVLDELSIEDIAVSAALHGKGIGTQILQALITMAQEQFVNALFLEVRRSNKAARNLYKSAGFELVGERKNYYPAHKGAEKENALVLKYFVA